MSKALANQSDLDVGDEITVNFALEKFAPIQFHSFDVGPFTCTTRVREGESGLEAMKRAYNVCLKMARESYPQKRDEFLENVMDAAAAAKEKRR